MIDEVDLPEGWTKKYSKEKNNYYYVNKATKEKSWKPPVASAAPAAVEVVPATEEVEEVQNADNDTSKWVEKFSKKHGKKYWKHSETGESSWKDPSKQAANKVAEDAVETEASAATGNAQVKEVPSSSSAGAGVPSAAVEENTKGAKEELDKVESLAAVGDAADAPQGSSSSSSSSISEEWTEKFSKKHGRKYWKHRTTGETSWKDPGEEAAPGEDNDKKKKKKKKKKEEKKENEKEKSDEDQEDEEETAPAVMEEELAGPGVVDQDIAPDMFRLISFRDGPEGYEAGSTMPATSSANGEGVLEPVVTDGTVAVEASATKDRHVSFDPALDSTPWVEKYSKKHSRRYWKHRETGETTWKSPISATWTSANDTGGKLDTAKTGASAPPASSSSTAEGGADSEQIDAAEGAVEVAMDKSGDADSSSLEWVEKFSKKHNRKYWKNLTTGESRWKYPHKESASSTPAADDDGNSEARDIQDSINVNMIARPPSPAAMRAESEAAASNSSSATQGTEGDDGRETLPTLWVQKFSKKHKRKFWKHSETGQTSWKEPEEVRVARSVAVIATVNGDGNDNGEEEGPTSVTSSKRIASIRGSAVMSSIIGKQDGANAVSQSALAMAAMNVTLGEKKSIDDADTVAAASVAVTSDESRPSPVTHEPEPEPMKLPLMDDAVEIEMENVASPQKLSLCEADFMSLQLFKQAFIPSPAAVGKASEPPVFSCWTRLDYATGTLLLHERGESSMASHAISLKDAQLSVSLVHANDELLVDLMNCETDGQSVSVRVRCPHDDDLVRFVASLATLVDAAAVLAKGTETPLNVEVVSDAALPQVMVALMQSSKRQLARTMIRRRLLRGPEIAALSLRLASGQDRVVVGGSTDGALDTTSAPQPSIPTGSVVLCVDDINVTASKSQGILNVLRTLGKTDTSEVIFALFPQSDHNAFVSHSMHGGGHGPYERGVVLVAGGNITLRVGLSDIQNFSCRECEISLRRVQLKNSCGYGIHVKGNDNLSSCIFTFEDVRPLYNAARKLIQASLLLSAVDSELNALQEAAEHHKQLVEARSPIRRGGARQGGNRNPSIFYFAESKSKATPSGTGAGAGGSAGSDLDSVSSAIFTPIEDLESPAPNTFSDVDNASASASASAYVDNVENVSPSNTAPEPGNMEWSAVNAAVSPGMSSAVISETPGRTKIPPVQGKKQEEVGETSTSLARKLEALIERLRMPSIMLPTTRAVQDVITEMEVANEKLHASVQALYMLEAQQQQMVTAVQRDLSPNKPRRISFMNGGEFGAGGSVQRRKRSDRASSRMSSISVDINSVRSQSGSDSRTATKTVVRQGQIDSLSPLVFFLRDNPSYLVSIALALPDTKRVAFADMVVNRLYPSWSADAVSLEVFVCEVALATAPHDVRVGRADACSAFADILVDTLFQRFDVMTFLHRACVGVSTSSADGDLVDSLGGGIISTTVTEPLCRKIHQLAHAGLVPSTLRCLLAGLSRAAVSDGGQKIASSLTPEHVLATYAVPRIVRHIFHKDMKGALDPTKIAQRAVVMDHIGEMLKNIFSGRDDRNGGGNVMGLKMCLVDKASIARSRFLVAHFLKVCGVATWTKRQSAMMSTSATATSIESPSDLHGSSATPSESRVGRVRFHLQVTPAKPQLGSSTTARLVKSPGGPAGSVARVGMGRAALALLPDDFVSPVRRHSVMTLHAQLATPSSMRDRVCLREADLGLLLAGVLDVLEPKERQAKLNKVLDAIPDTKSLLDAQLDDSSVVQLTTRVDGLDTPLGFTREDKTEAAGDSVDEVGKDMWLVDAARQALAKFRASGTQPNRSVEREMKSLYRNLSGKVPELLAVLMDFDRIQTCRRLVGAYTKQVDFLVSVLKGVRTGQPVGNEDFIEQELWACCEMEFLLTSQFYGTIGEAHSTDPYGGVISRLEDFPEYCVAVRNKNMSKSAGDESAQVNPLALLMKTVFPAAAIRGKDSVKQ